MATPAANSVNPLSTSRPAGAPVLAAGCRSPRPAARPSRQAQSLPGPAASASDRSARKRIRVLLRHVAVPLVSGGRLLRRRVGLSGLHLGRARIHGGRRLLSRLLCGRCRGVRRRLSLGCGGRRNGQKQRADDGKREEAVSHRGRVSRFGFGTRRPGRPPTCRRGRPRRAGTMNRCDALAPEHGPARRSNGRASGPAWRSAGTGRSARGVRGCWPSERYSSSSTWAPIAGSTRKSCAVTGTRDGSSHSSRRRPPTRA